MGSRKKQLYNFRILACLLVALFLFPGWKFSSGTDECGPITATSPGFSFEGNYGNSVYATDYGTNNDKIYVGFNSYFYGESKLGGDIDKVYYASAVQNISSNFDAAQLNNFSIRSWAKETINDLYKSWGKAQASGRGANDKAFNGKSPLNLSPATTVKYVIKVTRFVKLSAINKHGKKTYNITKGKLTQGLCSIKVDNTNIKRSMYYYRLETDDGTITKKWIC